MLFLSTTPKHIATNPARAEVSQWRCNYFKWVVMFLDLPEHKTKQWAWCTPAASRPTKARFFPRVLLACVSLQRMLSLGCRGSTVFPANIDSLNVSELGSWVGSPSPPAGRCWEPSQLSAGSVRTTSSHWGVALMARIHNRLATQNKEIWLDFWVVGETLSMRPNSKTDFLQITGQILQVS